MKKSKYIYFCPVCGKLRTVYRRLADRVPRCCGQPMKKVSSDG